MLGIKRIDHIPNTTIYEKPDTKPRIYLLQQEQLQFIGHVLRMNKEEPIYTISWQKTSRSPTNNIPELHQKTAWIFGRNADHSHDLKNSSRQSNIEKNLWSPTQHAAER